MIILNIKVEDSSPLGKMKREMSRIKREIMGEVAKEFVDNHLLPHFGPQNRARYGHARRNPIYAKEIKPRKGQGAGKYVDDIESGVSKRQIQATVRISRTQDRATVRASAPAYFVKPFIGSYVKEVQLKNGKIKRETKRITQQPDKVKELTTLDMRDREELAQHGVKTGERLWKERRATITKNIQG